MKRVLITGGARMIGHLLMRRLCHGSQTLSDSWPCQKVHRQGSRGLRPLRSMSTDMSRYFSDK